MKLEETIPEMTEDKFREEIQKIIDKQKLYGSYYYPLFRDRNWTPDELVNELNLIQNKKSKLSRYKRDAIEVIVTSALLNMTKND